MQATINLYETFSEALHTIQELEAAHIVPAEISLITKNGKPKRLDIDIGPQSAKPAKSKKGKHVKVVAPKPVEEGPIDRDLKAKFFTTLNLHELSGLGAVVGAGWLITEAMERTPSSDGGTMMMASGLIDSMVEHGLSLEHAETYIEGLKRGATLIGVKTPPALVVQAQRVMREEHRPLDPHMRGHHYWTTKNDVKEDKNTSANRMIAMLISTVR